MFTIELVFPIKSSISSPFYVFMSYTIIHLVVQIRNLGANSDHSFFFTSLIQQQLPRYVNSTSLIASLPSWSYINLQDSILIAKWTKAFFISDLDNSNHVHYLTFKNILNTVASMVFLRLMPNHIYIYLSSQKTSLLPD